MADERDPTPSAPDAAEWRALFALLDEALDLDDAARGPWLEALAARDPSRAERVAGLLAEREQVSREGFLGGQAVPPPVTGGRSGAMCGPYVLEALIGRGGMGSVWRGRRTDGRYEATVAIKLLSSPMLGADGEKRFRREGQILARLRHPNIAQLLDAGISDDGQPFLALEYVEGEHLDQWADARGLSVRERVRLFLDVLRAVAHAHTNLVVHRDLKPSNILVDADGRVVLLDFGIAKLITDEEGGPVATQLTREGAQVLTPRYAAPEQVTGGEVTTATDVYALGVVLCELLSGESPYRTPRASVGALEDAIVTGDPVRPSDLAPVVRRKVLRGDLDTIVLKALRKAPSERYATVTALADDLEAWLDGRPVRARPDAFGYRAARFVRRHALAVGATAAVFVAVLGGAGVALWQARVARAEAERAEEITNFITGIFREADPYERSEATLTAPELLQQAYARVQTSFADRPTLRFELTWLIGSSLANLQEYAAAEPVLFDAAAQADSLFATTDPERLKAQAALGGLMRYRGQLDRMDSLLTATLVTLRGMPEPPLPLLVTTLVDSAHLAIDRGNAPAAIAPARAADSLAVFFRDSALDQRVAAAQVLAIALDIGQAPPGDVLQAAERAMTLTKSLYGGRDNHPRVIEGKMTIARALAGLERLDEAIQVLTDADTASAESAGELNYTRAFIRGSRGSYRLRQDDRVGALEDYTLARRILRHHGDSTSPNYGVLRGNEGNVLLQLERFAEAEAPLRDAEAVLRGAWGDTHPRARQQRLRLMRVDAALGRTARVSNARAWLDAVAADSATLPADVQRDLGEVLALVRRTTGR